MIVRLDICVFYLCLGLATTYPHKPKDFKQHSTSPAQPPLTYSAIAHQFLHRLHQNIDDTVTHLVQKKLETGEKFLECLRNKLHHLREKTVLRKQHETTGHDEGTVSTFTSSNTDSPLASSDTVPIENVTQVTEDTSHLNTSAFDFINSLHRNSGPDENDTSIKPMKNTIQTISSNELPIKFPTEPMLNLTRNNSTPLDSIAFTPQENESIDIRFGALLSDKSNVNASIVDKSLTDSSKLGEHDLISLEEQQFVAHENNNFDSAIVEENYKNKKEGRITRSVGAHKIKPVNITETIKSNLSKSATDKSILHFTELESDVSTRRVDVNDTVTVIETLSKDISPNVDPNSFPVISMHNVPVDTILGVVQTPLEDNEKTTHKPAPLTENNNRSGLKQLEENSRNYKNQNFSESLVKVTGGNSSINDDSDDKKIVVALEYVLKKIGENEARKYKKEVEEVKQLIVDLLAVFKQDDTLKVNDTNVVKLSVLSEVKSADYKSKTRRHVTANRFPRSTNNTSDAAAILALLSEGGSFQQDDPASANDSYYYDNEDYSENYDENLSAMVQDEEYDSEEEPSFGELIYLASKHRSRKQRLQEFSRPKH